MRRRFKRMGCSACEAKARQNAARQAAAHINAANVLARPRPGFTPAVYRFRDTEQPPNTFEDADLTNLLARIVQHRFENKLPEIAHLKDVVINFTMLSAEAYAPYIEYYTPDHQVHLSASQYVKAALAFATAALVIPDDKLFVDAAIAEKRALHCLRCPFNAKVVNGRNVDNPTLAQSKFCQLSKDRPKTSVHGALGVCSQCTCVVSCKVNFSKEFIESASTTQLLAQLGQEVLGLDGRPLKCWIVDKDVE